MRLQAKDLKRFALLDVRNNIGWLSKIADSKMNASNKIKNDTRRAYRIRMQRVFDCLSGHPNKY